MRINAEPNALGNYGNPHSGREGYILPDELLPRYIEVMGFATITVEGDTVTALEENTEALEAYLVSLSQNGETPKQRREDAYNTLRVVEWDGNTLTVTEAATEWQYYAAEGSPKAAQLQALIATAKEAIRAQIPDEEE